MNIIDIIEKKMRKEALTYDELSFAFNGYVNNSIKDYQMSSLLMAIVINNLTDDEIVNLTDIFIKSGEVIDFSEFGVCADKHSTGGVGDKVTLIIGPIISSCQVNFPKMSGRGLGYTGGTIDKLESIPGINLTLSKEDLKKCIKSTGMFIASQTEEFVPMDKYIYALRSRSGTVSSTALIAVSIMSKKIAYGADIIFLDVKCGSGALIKTKDEALELIRIMKLIGKHFNKNVKCEISDMNVPLGDAVGNSLEIREAIEILDGKENSLATLCKDISAEIISIAKKISIKEASKLVESSIASKSALNKFYEFIKNQNGKIDEMIISTNIKSIISNKSGIIRNIDALKIAKLSFELGAGRINKEDDIDYSVGIVLKSNIGDQVEVGTILMDIYYNKQINFEKAIDCFEIEGK